ncbi:MAG: peptide-methionine (R)-S-oxide reductase MsrB [Capnocytophaga sp.]|nr:peptide-methionine (R)-S-oxide reductase MsrB [Capnocytophaga sp.]
MDRADEIKYPVQKTDAQWRELLTQEEYYILREKGTEYPHTGLYNTHFEEGAYHCKGCGQKLFESDSKFQTDCGWPGFDRPLDSAIIYQKDTSHGMVRVEILCSKCGGHLGHVFNDGPTETGLRYCVNSASLDFENEKDNIFER